MTALEGRFRQAVDQIDDQAAVARTRAHDPSVSRAMQQAHLHRATALTRAVRLLREALGDDVCGFPWWDDNDIPRTCPEPVGHDNGIHEEVSR